MLNINSYKTLAIGLVTRNTKSIPEYAELTNQMIEGIEAAETKTEILNFIEEFKAPEFEEADPKFFEAACKIYSGFRDVVRFQ